MVDISFTPPRPPDFPFDVELHHVLREGEAGFYSYVVASKPEDSPDALLSQLRFAMRVNESMQSIRLSDERWGVLPASEAIANPQGQVVDANEDIEMTGNRLGKAANEQETVEGASSRG